jgi:hypothetical protein
MNDTGKIIVGLVVFVGLFTYPIWTPVIFGKAGAPPKLELPKDQKQCVEATAEMRKSHMTLLDTWRDSVVREGKRLYVAKDGKQYLMSLQNTCFNCHKNKEQFCDKCHNYVNLSPKCWECHVTPEYGKEQKVAGRAN